MTSKTTMRRAIAKAGGHYNRQTWQWVLPGAMHNLTPWSTETRWFRTLDDAYAAVDEVVEANQRVMDFAKGESALIRRERRM